jgi:hypothetical protein
MSSTSSFAASGSPGVGDVGADVGVGGAEDFKIID